MHGQQETPNPPIGMLPLLLSCWVNYENRLETNIELSKWFFRPERKGKVSQDFIQFIHSWDSAITKVKAITINKRAIKTPQLTLPHHVTRRVLHISIRPLKNSLKPKNEKRPLIHQQPNQQKLHATKIQRITPSELKLRLGQKHSLKPIQPT